MYIPWFGRLPFYALDFLSCCEAAKNIIWVVHSDQSSPKKIHNVIWKIVDAPTLLIRRVFPSAPSRFWGHKLCDLKPYWNEIFGPCNTRYWGWCDWDVYHNLTDLVFDFESLKFTNGTMCSPIFIQKTGTELQYFPVGRDRFLFINDSVAWDEIYYLKHVDSKILQRGLTPEVDLFERAKYAVHMYRAKHIPDLYRKWIDEYFINPVNHK